MRWARPVFLVFVFSGCAAGIASRDGAAWGTSWTLVIDSAHENQAASIVTATIDRYTQIFSTYDADSEIQRINAMLPVQTAVVSEPMQKALLLSRRLCEQSGGAFWPFLGSTMISEGFEPDRLRTPPTSSSYPSIPSSPRNCQYIEIAGNRFTRHSTDRLNLNALAEGLLLDAIHAEFQKARIASYLIGFGGEYNSGAPSALRDAGWLVAVESLGSSSLRPFTINEQALSTSGTYRNRIGRKSHLIDASGKPIDELRSASVICSGTDRAATADGLATTTALLNWKKALSVMRLYPRCALLLQREKDGQIEIQQTPSWPLPAHQN